MSNTNDPYVQGFYQQQVDSSASRNAGTWEAQNGYTPSAQQFNESASAYQNRIDAYNYASKK